MKVQRYFLDLEVVMLLLFLYCVGASDLRSLLVGWLVGKRHARSGEGERQGEIGGKDGKILWKSGGVFFASTQAGACVGGEKSRNLLALGPGFLFVETRHAPSRPKSLATPPSRDPAFTTRAVAEKRRECP